MPRPKLDPNSVYTRELRITPPDGEPITDWKLGTDFIKAVIAQEGGDEDCRLHYHAYIETSRSASWITKWIYSIAHCYNGEQGNTVFFSRKPHDNTLGYVVKHGNIVVRHGVTETFITEWLDKSEQYRKDKDSARARAKRMKKSFTQAVCHKIVEEVKTDPSLRNPARILELILAEYHASQMIYPSRTVVENLIVTILSPYDAYLPRAFYLRNFEPR